jgi:hypothetical protein
MRQLVISIVSEKYRITLSANRLRKTELPWGEVQVLEHVQVRHQPPFFFISNRKKKKLICNSLLSTGRLSFFGIG